MTPPPWRAWLVMVAGSAVTTSLFLGLASPAVKDGLWLAAVIIGSLVVFGALGLVWEVRR